jgi:hypothetical protein
MSKRKQEKEGQEEGQKGPTCPMCRDPLLFGSKDGSKERTLKITREFMTGLMNTWGGCDSKFLNPKTNLLVAPKLEKGSAYATHPETQACVRWACKNQGPHQCQTHACVAPFCNNSLKQIGCQCGSLSADQKKMCRDATWSKEDDQQASGADKRRKVKVKEQMPAPPAPAPPAPAPPAPQAPAPPAPQAPQAPAPPAPPESEVIYVSD